MIKKDITKNIPVGKEDTLNEDEMHNWELWMKAGFFKWYLRDGLLDYFIPITIVLLFIINPLIIGKGISYFYTKDFIVNMFIVVPIALIASILQSFVKWNRANKSYKKSIQNK